MSFLFDSEQNTNSNSNTNDLINKVNLKYPL